MKKTLIVLSIALIGFTACGGGDKKENETADTTKATADEAAPEPDPTEEDAGVDEADAQPGGPIDQRDPEKVVEGIFAVATNGDYKSLGVLCAPDADGDCKKICNLATASSQDQAEFKKAFGNGGVVDTDVNDNKAEVEIKFGEPGKEKKETMKLELKDGKWYLKSF